MDPEDVAAALQLSLVAREAFKLARLEPPDDQLDVEDDDAELGSG